MTNAENDLPPNVISGKRSDEDQARPDWVPAGAIWENGLWRINGVSVQRAGLDPNVTRLLPADHRAQQALDAANRQAKLTQGLPPGQFRQGGLIWERGQRGNTVVDSDDGSSLPGYAETRAARIERIQKASARHQAAIKRFEMAKLAMEVAEAEFHKSYEALETD